MSRGKKKTATKTVAVPRSNQPGITLSPRARSIVCGAIGASLGAWLGFIFGENPQSFFKAFEQYAQQNPQFMAVMQAMQNSGVGRAAVHLPPPPHDLWPSMAAAWLEKGQRAVWIGEPADEMEHAYALVDQHPCVSACGKSYQPEVLLYAAPKGRCKDCVKALKKAGYKVDAKVPVSRHPDEESRAAQTAARAAAEQQHTKRSRRKPKSEKVDGVPVTPPAPSPAPVRDN